MKFTTSSSLLLKQLSAISGVVASSPILPILENFLFELKGDMLTVKASDLQSSMITKIEVSGSEDGIIAVPAKILTDTLRNLPEQPVNIHVDNDSYTVNIQASTGKYKLAGENAVDFPKVQPIENGFAIDIPADVLMRAVNNTIFATSNDDLRPALTGVLFRIDEDSIMFVATDGHRLVRYKRTDIGAKEPASNILPKKSLTLLKNMLSAGEETVTTALHNRQAYFKSGNVELICRLIDENFPDFENAIPKNNEKELQIDRKMLMNSLKRISIYANKSTYQIRLEASENELTLFAEDVDFSNEANEKLTCEYSGESITIGFNARLLLEMLTHIETDVVTIEMSDPSRAALLLPQQSDPDEDTLMLIMPVMLNSYV